MKVNNLGYLLKEGIRGVFKHGFMSFAAVCVTVACLLIVGSFSCLIYNLNLIVEDLNKTNEILVYVDETYSDAKARSVSTSINRIENVYSAKFITREQALAAFAGRMGNGAEYQDLDPAIFEYRYSVILKDNRLLKETVEALKQVPGVVDVGAEDKMAEGFSTLQDVLHVVSALVIGVLLVVSLLIISNTVKLAMYDRKDEIAIMKMVGATNGFIRIPFVVEGFILGMLGAGIAFGLEWLMYDALVARIENMNITLQLFTFVPFTELLGYMIAVFFGAGLFVGIVGSWSSIRKFMDV